MQSNSHSLSGLGSYPVPNSHLPLKTGTGGVVTPSSLSSLATPATVPSSNPDIDCAVDNSGYTEKSANSWKYQSFQVLWKYLFLENTEIVNKSDIK